MRRRLLIAAFLFVLVAVSLLPGMVVLPTSSPIGPCRGRTAQLLVHTPSKRMWFCEAGQPVESFRVGLGRGGVGKRVEGDGKMPIGDYPLGAPRPSSRYHLFIPVGYPTTSERSRGFTGGDIGVHGPTFFIRWLPGGATWFNRTRGCVELGSRGEIERVAAWVRSGRITAITIE